MTLPRGRPVPEVPGEPPSSIPATVLAAVAPCDV